MVNAKSITHFLVCGLVNQFVDGDRVTQEISMAKMSYQCKDIKKLNAIFPIQEAYAPSR